MPLQFTDGQYLVAAERRHPVKWPQSLRWLRSWTWPKARLRGGAAVQVARSRKLRPTAPAGGGRLTFPGRTFALAENPSSMNRRCHPTALLELFPAPTRTRIVTPNLRMRTCNGLGLLKLMHRLPMRQPEAVDE